MKRIVISLFTLFSIGIVILITHEYFVSLDIQSKPIKQLIYEDLKKRYGDDIELGDIDGNAEDNTRVVYFEYLTSGKQKTAIYVESFFPNRIKFSKEVENY